MPDAKNAQTLLLEFDPPLSLNGMSCSELVLREPTMGEVKKAEKWLDSTGIGRNQAWRRYSVALVAAVSGTNEMLLDEMPISKFSQAANFLAGFLSSGQQDGDEPAEI